MAQETPSDEMRRDELSISINQILIINLFADKQSFFMVYVYDGHKILYIILIYLCVVRV